jgi:hypothetical protein
MSIRRLVALVSVLVAMVAAVAPASAAKDYRVERFHARIVVEPNGSIVVTETIRFVFGADSLTSVYRELTGRKTDGITILGATMDGQPMALGKQPGQYELKKTDNGRRRVIWHFAEVTGAARTFTLTYRVNGVAWRDTDADVLAWTLLPTKHEYLIECASGEVEYPATTSLIGGALFEPAASDLQVEGQTMRFRRCPFEKDDYWVVTLRFAPRTLAAVAPAWQQRARLTSENAPRFLGLAAFILITGAGGFVFFALNHRVPTIGDRDGRQPAPPDDLSPALAGALTRTGASAAWADALASLFDLARRRVIRIDALPVTGVFKKHDFQVTAGPAPQTLTAHEGTLLELLFTTKSGPRPIVKFSDLSRTFASAGRWKRFCSSVADDLRAAGLLDSERERTRGRVTALGVAIMLFSIVGFALSAAFLNQAGEAVLALPIAILVSGIVGLATGVSMSPLSDEGHGRAQRWKAFGRHLDGVSKHAEGEAAAPRDFERLLPYAAAFGVALAWAKRLEKRGVGAGPSWLQALASDGAAHGAPMAATIAMLSAGHNAGAHAGGSAAGAAGAAGGGSSGAG